MVLAPPVILQIDEYAPAQEARFMYRNLVSCYYYNCYFLLLLFVFVCLFVCLFSLVHNCFCCIGHHHHHRYCGCYYYYSMLLIGVEIAPSILCHWAIQSKNGTSNMWLNLIHILMVKKNWCILNFYLLFNCVGYDIKKPTCNGVDLVRRTLFCSLVNLKITFKLHRTSNIY